MRNKFFLAVTSTITVALFILAVGFANLGVANASQAELDTINAAQTTWFEAYNLGQGDTDAYALALDELAVLEHEATAPACKEYAGFLLVLNILFIESIDRESPFIDGVVLGLIDSAEETGYACLIAV